MKKEELIARIEHLIQQGKEVLATTQYIELYGTFVNSGKQMGFRTASLSFIKLLYGENHIYYNDFDKRVNGYGIDETENGINILQSIKHEIENDWLITFKELVSAEIFSDFLEMARYLLDQNFKDAAAVTIGSVLEEHLRMLWFEWYGE